MRLAPKRKYESNHKVSPLVMEIILLSGRSKVKLNMQAFTREFQVDLSKGKIAAYKGAIIEILEATNVQIKYKFRNFSSDS